MIRLHVDRRRGEEHRFFYLSLLVLLISYPTRNIQEALPSGDVLLLVVIFLRRFWSCGGLVLLHYPHPSSLYCSTERDF